MSANTAAVLLSDDATAPEKHRRKKSKKGSKKGRSAINMNCFDLGQENDGALDIHGNPDPRFATDPIDEKCDATRFRDKVVDAKQEQVAAENRNNNSVLENMLKGSNANSPTDYDSEAEQGKLSALSYGPVGSDRGDRRGLLDRMRSLSNRSLDGRDGHNGTGEGVFRKSPSSRDSTRRASCSHSRRRLSLTRKVRTYKSTPNIKANANSKQEDAPGVGQPDECARSVSTTVDVSDGENKGTNKAKITATTFPVEETRGVGIKVTQKITLTSATKIDDDIPLEQAAAFPPKSAIAHFTRRRSLNFRPSRGGRPSMQRAMSTPALLQTPNTCRSKSILKRDDGAQKKRRGSVRFDRIETREFDRTIGDNPSVSCGIPIGLDWKYNPETIVKDLEDYEDNRGPRRPREALALTPSAREYMLIREWGITFRELHQTNQKTDSIKQKRWESATQTPYQARVEEALETTKRRVNRVIKRTSEKREQERLWKQAQDREQFDR